jgi:hypothetical protein
MQINSACPAANGGALGTNGNAATITLNNGAVIRMVGGFVPGPLTLSPLPITGQRAVKDPLAGMPAMPIASMPVRSASRQTLSGGDTVLQPGVYIGGIQMRNSARAFMRPGIYVFQGGGFAVGAQNAVYSVGAAVSSTTDATWAANCPVASCGVLLYNTGTASGASAMGELAIGAGATMRLRPYQPTADETGANMTEFRNLLLWQDANPVPTSSYAQPTVSLNGGGTVEISGTVYAPSAMLAMGGGSGGSGGSSTDLTLQFITWDLQLQGNSSFHFFYQTNAFAMPTDYGLIR